VHGEDGLTRPLKTHSPAPWQKKVKRKRKENGQGGGPGENLSANAKQLDTLIRKFQCIYLTPRKEGA